ncbi:MAG: hypothetical protein IJ498_05735 [Akkermansia sp.]|nr:hypothetical protein [Akkermansia sp.]
MKFCPCGQSEIRLAPGAISAARRAAILYHYRRFGGNFTIRRADNFTAP